MSDLASAIGVCSDDDALVAQLKTGSEQAFSLLLALYAQPIYSLLTRSLRDPADAADVTQEVFVKVFRNISGFHGDSSLKTWIYRIALHEASNQRRWWFRHKRQETTLDAPVLDEDGCSTCLGDRLPSHDASPLENAVNNQSRLRITAALAAVPQTFREVVVLREIEGFGYEQIAEILGVNLGTVKSRLTRGRACLRESLLQQSQPVAARAGTSVQGVMR